MSPDPAADLARLRGIALACPRAVEKVSHGQPVCGIEGGRLFAHYRHDHHGDGRSAVTVKTSGPEEQAMLIERDDSLFYKPAYIGPAGWIAIRTDVAAPDWERIAGRVEASWRMVAPCRLLEAR